MKGIDKALIEEIKEGMSIESAMSELPDCGFDFGRRRIDIILNEEENYIRCMNDGVPMRNINDFLDRFKAHLKQSVKRKELISTFGKGTKKAFIRLGDARTGSIFNIYAKDKDVNAVEHGALNMKYKRNGECFDVKHVSILKDMGIIPYPQGTCHELINPEPEVWGMLHGLDENGEPRHDYGAFINYCKEHYGLIAYKNNIDLYVNGEKIEFEDPCYLKNLGDKIKKDGTYVINGICYWVHTYTAHNKIDGKDVKFKVVYVFIPRITMPRMKNIKGFEQYSGYYTYYSNRLMDNGGNYRKFFNRPPSNITTGGCDRIRIAIFTDKNESFFKITSTKANGIEPFQYNENFTTYKSSGFTLYSILRNDLISFLRMNNNDRDGGTIKEINFGLLKEVSRSLTDTKKRVVSTIFSPKINPDELTLKIIEDELGKKIDNCPNITQRERDILYSVLRTSQLKKRASSTEFIDNALKEIEKYERCTISNIEGS